MLSKYELCKIKASQDWTYKMEIGLTTPYKDSIIPTDPPQIFKQTKAFQLRFYYDREMKREIALFGCWEIRKKKYKSHLKTIFFVIFSGKPNGGLIQTHLQIGESIDSETNTIVRNGRRRFYYDFSLQRFLKFQHSSF